MGFAEETVTVSREDFWNGIKIYVEKPNSVNKEVLYSEITVLAKYDFEITEAKCQALCDEFYNLIFTENKSVGEIVNLSGNILKEFTLSDNKVLDDWMNCSCVILRKLQPKLPDSFDMKFYEVGFFDAKANVARFYSLYDKSFESNSDVPLETKKFDPLAIVKFNKISVHHGSDSFVVHYDDDLGEKGCNWITSVFAKKLKKLISPKNESSGVCVMNFTNEVNLIKYYTLYEKLKLKYAKNLIENWSEVTDPKKFVFEDIAISSYLLLLWNNGEIPNENSEKKKFVDLGCGNGLLVFLLNSEGHQGMGLDVAKRQIWNTYPPNVILKEEAIIPGPGSVYPGVDWLIGNHSDELTPWVPIMARRSGIQCQFFLLPCCPYQLNGETYQRKNSALSAYHDYIHYVRKISELCEFETCLDRLRIPSTKKICIIGKRKYLSAEKLVLINKEIDSFIAGESSESGGGNSETVDSDTKYWISGFKVRQARKPARNCTSLPKDLIDEIISVVANNLLKQKNIIVIENNNETKDWNQGGRIHIGDLANMLSQEQLRHLKDECKGLQTLIKNHHYVFSVSEGMVSFRHIQEIFNISYRVLRKGSTYKWKQKECWFDKNHPDGCPLPSDICSYKHKDD